MSRVAKEKIDIKKITKYSIEKNAITVEGPLGINKVEIPDFLVLSTDEANKTISVELTDEAKVEKSKHQLAMHGTIVRLIKNAVTGVTDGFKKVFLFKGLGYKCALNNNQLTMNIGYSHQVIYDLPKDVKALLTKHDRLELSCKSNELLGRCKDKLVKFRKWNPYSGKGIMEEGTIPYTKPVVKAKK
jgi:large subunit ribosomal protein L6